MARHICFIINNVGEYHAARLNHCASSLAASGDRVTVIEPATGVRLYTHKQRRADTLLRGVGHIRLHTAGRAVQTEWALWRALMRQRPSHIFTIGYSDRLSAVALAYANLFRVPIFFMADSKADDQPRSRRGELVKSAVLRGFDGALVAGGRHRDYFRSLGMKGPIEIGFDVIDNAFFRRRAEKLLPRAGWLVRKGLLPERYVLCVSRLIDRKRVDLALRIFAESGVAARGVRLLLIGSGPLDREIHEQARALGIADALCHHRNVRNTLMPLFYARADALILASEYDQWGLCVNEAQAIGVPCIVTRRCGVAGEIVVHGKNGYVFDPGNAQIAVDALRELVANDDLRRSLGDAAAGTMERWGLPAFSGAVARLVGAHPSDPAASAASKAFAA
ncbi:glycosyltransferase [Novosphingobium sp. KCTC 2891]|uniref:glycosyltransferase n=1 Tax=Novosphingobium sp. KCTC 2891 TaxID=2989730 RepID=UPI002222D1A3|nr:glycosyltransferase [Novosphingobium sp. KCTC 2891]MCW1383262.1 glycosyltransferase [Novosphingobium sp. KCTC 2891]